MPALPPDHAGLKASFRFPSAQPELRVETPRDEHGLPTLDGMGGGSFFDIKPVDSEHKRQQSVASASSIYSDARRSRVEPREALDDIVKFTNIQAEHLLSPEGSLQDLSFQYKSPVLGASAPESFSTNSSSSSLVPTRRPLPPSAQSSVESVKSNLAPRISPSQPPTGSLPPVPTSSSRSAEFAALPPLNTSPLTCTNAFEGQLDSTAPNYRRPVPPAKENNNTQQLSELKNQYQGAGIQEQLSSFGFAPHKQPQHTNQQEQASSTFPKQQATASYPPAPVRPDAGASGTMGASNSSTMKNQKLQKVDSRSNITKVDSTAANEQPSQVTRKIPTPAPSNFANLRSKLRPSEESHAPSEPLEKTTTTKTTESKLSKFKSKFTKSDEDENRHDERPAPHTEASGSSWSRLKSKVKGKSAEEDKPAVPTPSLTPTSTQQVEGGRRLGSPFKPAAAHTDPPAAPVYQAFRPAPRDALKDKDGNTIRPLTPLDNPLHKTPEELAITPVANIHPLFRSSSESPGPSTETLRQKMQNGERQQQQQTGQGHQQQDTQVTIRAPAPAFAADFARNRASSTKSHLSRPNNNLPPLSRNNSNFNSPIASPTASGFPFPADGNGRPPKTAPPSAPQPAIPRPKNNFPLLQPGEPDQRMAAILAKSPFLHTPAAQSRSRKVSRKAVESNPTSPTSPQTDGARSSSSVTSPTSDPEGGAIIFPAPEITLCQLECYQNHRQMRTSRNDVYAVACGVCGVEDRGKRWCCSWCALRCCQECIKNLRSSDAGLAGVLMALGKGSVLERLSGQTGMLEQEQERTPLASNGVSFDFDGGQAVAI